MIKREAIIENEVGLHARPAAKFVKTANSFNCKIMIKCNNNSVNAKSLLDVLTLGAEKGTRIEIVADGSDENEAVDLLCELIENGLSES
jgi:phosphocarrier protein HPr